MNKSEKIKKKWLRLYEVAQQIRDMQPWNDFSEDDKFSYIWKDKSKTVLFSFIGESIQKCGIACYTCEEDYIRARVRLTDKNIKQEPIFMLQNALICIWDDREKLSKENYELIKELGFKPRGKGAWLHFDYVPGDGDVRKGSAAITGRLCVIGSKIDRDALSELFGVELK